MPIGTDTRGKGQGKPYKKLRKNRGEKAFQGKRQMVHNRKADMS